MNDYVVSNSEKKNFASIIVTLGSVLLAVFKLIDIYSGGEEENLVVEFIFVGVAVLSGLFSIYSIYRPKVVVRGYDLICYPEFGWKRIVNKYDITRRTEKIIFESVAGKKKKTNNTQIPEKERQITYYTGDKKLITLSSKFENINRLDHMIRARLGEDTWTATGGYKNTALFEDCE